MRDRINFCGLPGLIVRISDNKNQYHFELTSLKKLAIPIEIALPNKPAILTTKKEFTKGLRDYQANAIDVIAQNGQSYGDMEAQKGVYREKMKTRNNFLELK